MFEGKILLVDDQPVAAQDSIAALEHFAKPSQILFAGDAKAARQILDTEPVRLAFLDIEMPGGDGFSLAAYIEDRHPSLPYVFLTGHADFALESYEYERWISSLSQWISGGWSGPLRRCGKRQVCREKRRLLSGAGQTICSWSQIRSSTYAKRNGRCRSTGRTEGPGRPPTRWRSWSGSS